MTSMRSLLVLLFVGTSIAAGQGGETLPALKDGQAPRNFDEMWAGFDPRAEPLEIEVLKEWEEDGVVCHLINICRKLGRKLKWDPQAEKLLGDDEANQQVARPRRQGYELPQVG